ncbi:MAG: hypothetical protein GX880_01720 [Methanomicrobiales archaeon]|nr:hypothetical protein [Methanomicrobiales archaeon]
MSETCRKGANVRTTVLVPASTSTSTFILAQIRAPLSRYGGRSNER